MNVNLSYRGYIHTHFESYFNVEWLKITNENVLFKDSNNTTHVIPIKKLVGFTVTQ